MSHVTAESLRRRMDEASELMRQAESATARARAIHGEVYHGLGVLAQRGEYEAGVAEGLRQAEAAVKRERYVAPYCPADIDFCCANARRKIACSCPYGPRVPQDIWVAVSFNPHRDGRMYYYVTNDVTIKPGTKVRVPSGRCNEPKDAWVVYTRHDKPCLGPKPIKRVYGRV